MREWGVFFLGVVILMLAISEWAYRVTIDDEKISFTFKLLPFLPPWHETASWSNVMEVHASPDLFLPENSQLMFTYRSPERRTKHLAIFLFTLRYRRDLIQEILSRIPSHAMVPPDLATWTETHVRYPKWQIIFLIGGVIFGIAMFWSAYRESHLQQGSAPGNNFSGGRRNAR